MSKLDRLGWVACDWFEIEGQRFGVRSTSEAFATWVRRVLDPYRVDGPVDPDDDPLYGLVVEDETSRSGRVGRRLNVLYLGTWDIVRTTDPGTVARSFLLDVQRLAFAHRDDAVYLDGAVVSSNGTTVLVPQSIVPTLSRAGRRVQRALDAMLPGTMAVAVDPETGRLIPVPSLPDVPDDASDAFRTDGPRVDPRAWVDEALSVDRVLLYGSEPELVPVSRAETLAGLSSAVRNLDVMRGRAIRALGRLVEGSRPYRVRFTGTAHMIEILSSLVNGAGPGS
ncbi:MAG: hypothetical protein ACE14W_04565 [Candidatus Velamenicoccus archaeovorus]